MRKFTLLLVAMVLSLFNAAQAKDITIYVQADQQPNIHFWNVSNESTEWPGQAMTATTTVTNLQGEEVTFYYKTFTDLADDAAISFLFNFNGDEDKTADINGISDDHYYIFNGNHEYEDITNQFRNVDDAVIGAVQLPGDYCSWTGDNAPLTNVDARTFTITPDFSAVTSDIVTFKLLVNSGSSWYWLGYNEVNVEAPDGWAQEAASDQNIQLNIGAIGTKDYTITATWDGGDNAAANWTVKIEADADAIIEKVQLPGSYCGWNGDNAVLTKKGDRTYTYTLDLTASTNASETFKLLVNNRHWLGYYDLVSVDAPEGWAQEAESDGNIQLNLETAGVKEFTVTATWAGGVVASAGWTVKVDSITTGINELTRQNEQDNITRKAVYDLQGRLIAADGAAVNALGTLSKGMYIVNGKKVIMK